MPRANRCFVPGHVWHLTHRCHHKKFLLKFARDRRRWRYWLFEAKKRFGLSILDYIVTCNHIHLLVFDRGAGEISRSMQLIAGRTAQEYNLRKGLKGAFWEDRYHATAVDTQGYLARCLTYIDMNMVRAGVVSHPGQWPDSGYCEIMTLPERYRTIDVPALLKLLGLSTVMQLQDSVAQWVAAAGSVVDGQKRDAFWSDSLAVGSHAFVEHLKTKLGIRATHRQLVGHGEVHCLKEPTVAYGFPREIEVLRDENTVLLGKDYF